MAEVKKFLSPVFRASFTQNVFKPGAMEEGGEPKYGLTAIWDPSRFSPRDKELWAKIMAELDSECMARFKKKWADLPGNFKRGIRDGSEKEGLEGFGAGKLFASLTTKLRPGVVDAAKNPIGLDHGNTDEIYPGCFCRATVTVYTYENKGKGAAVGLMNLQKVGDGARIDGRTDAAGDFEDEVDDGWMEQDDDPLA